MTARVCIEPGCPAIGAWKRSRCPIHDRARDKARGSTTERGYGSTHVNLRATYQRRMDAGERFTCWRCGEPIDPTRWQLGHDDHDRATYRGPECLPCNLSTNSRHISRDA